LEKQIIELQKENLEKINEMADRYTELEQRLKQTLGVLGIPYNDQSCENLTSLDGNSAIKYENESWIKHLAQKEHVSQSVL
tara:strand:- start:211 stop:453 length:243 start_codon:yes stop_codon:yes gene_type:complete